MILLLQIALCLVFLAIFSGIEIAFISVNKMSLEVGRMRGNQRAAFIAQLSQKPERFLTASLIVFNTLLAITTLLIEKAFYLWYPPNNPAHPNWHYLLTETFITAFLVFLIGEVIPKIIFQKKNLYFILLFVPLISIVTRLLAPITRVVTGLSEYLLKIFFKVKHTHPVPNKFTYTDLEEYVQLSTQPSYENKQPMINKAFVDNLLGISDMKVRDCMIQKQDIEAVSYTEELGRVKKKFIETKLSRLVVFDGDIDNIKGYIHQLDLFHGKRSVAEMLLQMPAVPETMSVQPLIHQLSTDKRSMAWVVDEYGFTAGIVTMETLLEKIFGEIKDEHDVDDLIEQKISHTEYLFSGKISLDLLQQKYHINLPKEEVTTLAGLLIKVNKGLPQVNQSIKIKRYLCTIVSVQPTTIDLIKIMIGK